ncbi:MAG: hypothetical protein RL660_662 [Bacteroidota bacterium]
MLLSVIALFVATPSFALSSVTSTSTTTAAQPHKSKKQTAFGEAKQKVLEYLLVKKLRKGAPSDISQTVYIILTILSLGWLAIGLLTDWQGSDWLVALAITAAGYILFGLIGFFVPFIWLLGPVPGIVYCIMKMKEYYK